jgi:hypothetical protein
MPEQSATASNPSPFDTHRGYRITAWVSWILVALALGIAQYIWPLRLDALCVNNNGCVLWQDNRFFFLSIWVPALGTALFAALGAFSMRRNVRMGIGFALLALPFFAWQIIFLILLSGLKLRV